jgi:ATP-dependent Clp protease ATP-binding subunit ClpX
METHHMEKDTEKNTDIQSQDPRTIEKELGEFLNKKFGGSVKIITPSTLVREDRKSGSTPFRGKEALANFDIRPRELIAYLDQYVVKQDKAKSVLATKICTHFHRIRHSHLSDEGMSKITGTIKSNMLMLGPTGIGKTYLIKLIAKKIGVPFVKADATKFSETGYVGGDVEDIIRDLVKEANDDIELAECGIVYIDEIDKIAASPNVIGSQVSRTGVQRALLKPMEESEVDLKVPHDPISMMQELEHYHKTGKRSRKRVNTANILFIVSGAFSGLNEVIKQRLDKNTIGFGSKLARSLKDDELLKEAKAEDLVEFGFESEFIGRLPIRCILDTLSEEDLYTILKMPNNPVILSKRLDFSAYGIKIVFTDDALRFFAKKAALENTGARGLVSVVEDSLLDFEEKLPSRHVSCFAVTKELLMEPKAHLDELLSLENTEKFDAIYEETFADYQTNIIAYINDKWQALSLKHSLALTEVRCKLVAHCFSNNVMEIEAAVTKIKNFHDTVKEVEVEVLKSSNLNIIFEEDAIDFIIEQFVYNKATTEEIISKIYSDFYDGLNLVREKTGRDRFFLSKQALTDHQDYLDELIIKEIK